MSIGDNIKKIREGKNLKQSDLAEMIGVSDKTVSSWEINRTEPKMGMIEKISAALNCKKTDIIGEDTTPFSQISTLAAHFEGEFFTEDEIEEIKQFAEFVKNKRKK